MNCPNWFSLVTRRDDEPELWDRALEHYDSCDRCREEALDAEPTLLFRQMPAPELGRADLDAIKQAVTTMRRTLPLTEAPEPPAPRAQQISRPQRKAFRSPRTWLQAAAVGAVLLGATWFQGSIFQSTPEKEGAATEFVSSSSFPRVESTLPAPAGPVDILPLENTGLEELPLVEDADPSYGSIVEVVGQDISFVLVVPSLDV